MEKPENAPTGEVAPVEQEDRYRIDWESNHEKIRKVISDSLAVSERMPTYKEMAEATGLHADTCKRHIRELKGDVKRFEKFRAGTEDVIRGIRKGAMAGDARCAKLYFQFVEDWEERKRITNVNQNPYAEVPDEDLRKKLGDRLAKLRKGAGRDPGT